MSHRVSYNLFVTVIIALGGFVFGFDASVISGVVGFVTTEFQLNEVQQGFVVSSPTLGAALGSIFAGPLADKFGRKKVIVFIAALYVISATFSAFAVSYEMLVVARMIGGVAFASLVLAPMYIAEIAEPNLRGKMISVNQFNIVIGLSAAYFANYYLLQMSESGSILAQSLGITENVWRWMLGLELVPAVAFLLLLATVPESPRWLALNGYQDKAKVVMAKLFPSQNPEQLIAQIQAETKDLPPVISRVKGLFAPNIKIILLVGIIVAVSQQITGVNAIYFYAPTIFEQSGIGQNAAFSQAIWVGVINVIFTIVAMMLIDKIGRRPLMLIGLAGVFISMSIASYGFSQATYTLTPKALATLESPLTEKLSPMVGQTYQSDVEFKQQLSQHLGEVDARANQASLIQLAATMNPTLILIGILGFVASFAVSLGPVMWVLLAEIFPNHLRGVGIAATGLINSCVSFSIQQLFPWQLANLGTAATFMIYGGFAVLGFVLLYRMLPETKGLSLENLEKAFHKTSDNKPQQEQVAL